VVDAVVTDARRAVCGENLSGRIIIINAPFSSLLKQLLTNISNDMFFEYFFDLSSRSDTFAVIFFF
jgi:hypothetical protein